MTKTITKQEPKLSVRKPGHWRNKWWYGVDDPIFEGGITSTYPTRQPDGSWLSGCRWPTAEIAEQKAQEDIAILGLQDGDRYLGPVFFPEGDDA